MPFIECAPPCDSVAAPDVPAPLVSLWFMVWAATKPVPVISAKAATPANNELWYFLIIQSPLWS
jgi:hypothetical protein